MLNLINYVFNSQTVQVLFWTLIHSLWQGIVVAFVTAIILVSTKRSATALRYKLLSGTLMLFIIASAVTCCYEIFSIVNYNAESNKPAVVFQSAAVNAGNHTTNIIQTLISLLQPYERLIVLIWLAVIIIKCLGLAKGLRDVYVLKHRRVFDVGEYWNNRLKILAGNSGIKKQVLLLKSTLAKVPVVVGYFKPVILFPAAALTALAPEEIEAVLLHELAHIRRKDYLVNIFQRIIEIIFFFNPAVLWISSLIKEERENCCDDVAVKQTKNKKQFIHALVSFQQCNTSGYAPSFSGRKNLLLNRIKRIITNNNKTLSTMEKTFLAAGMVVTVCAAFAFSQHKQSSFKNSAAKQSAQIAFTVNKKDTVPEPVNDNNSKYTISNKIDGKQYRLVEVNGKVTALYIDNVKIPGDKISGYNDVINRMKANFEAAKQNRHEAVKAQSEALKAQIELMHANKLAAGSQLKANVQNMQAQAKELQQEMMKIKMNNDSGKIQGSMEALKAEAALLQQKALAMSDVNNTVAEAQLQALKTSPAGMQKELLAQVQAEKLAASANESNMINAQAEKFAAIAKQQALNLEQNEKQSEIIKDKTGKIINEELKKQIEDLKRQNEKLEQQLRQKTDSLHTTPAIHGGA